VRKPLAALIAGSLGMWALSAYPAQQLGGNVALVYSTVAAALSLVPAAGTLVWSSWASKRSAEQQLLTILGGTGLRMAVVLGVGLALYTLVPLFGRSSFWLWVLVFYLFTLTLEIALLMAGQPATRGAKE
jgi:hypothetical protein